MPYTNLDDGFFDSPKMLQVGPLGMALHLAGISYSNRQLTNGFVPAEIWKRLLDLEREGATLEEVTERLVAAHLWVKAEGGWQIRDPHIRDRKTVLALRKERSDAGKNGGLKSGQVRRARSPNEALASTKSEATASSNDEAAASTQSNPSQSNPSSKPANGRTKKFDAWNEVLHEIGRVGYAQRPDFNDPLTHDIVRLMGGWQTVCEARSSDIRSTFLKLYDEQAASPRF